MKESFSRLFVTLLLFVLSVEAISVESALYSAFKESFKKPYFSVGALLQVVADYQGVRTFSGNNGYSIANARLKLSGDLDSGLSYLFQANFASSPSILDARLSYSLFSSVTLSVGQFKVPFGAEFLTSAANIDFVNRFQGISLLGPGRQIGVQLWSRFVDNRIHLLMGMFNGNAGSANNNDNMDFLYAGRIEGVLPLRGGLDSKDKLKVGTSFALSKDTMIPAAGNLFSSFTGDRILFGADMRMRIFSFQLGSEFICARLSPISATTKTPCGLHGTLGYFVSDKVEVLGRWDSLWTDNLAPNSHLIVLGMNWWPSEPTELQVNYVIPTKDASLKFHRILVNIQLAL